MHERVKRVAFVYGAARFGREPRRTPPLPAWRVLTHSNDRPSEPRASLGHKAPVGGAGCVSFAPICPESATAPGTGKASIGVSEGSRKPTPRSSQRRSSRRLSRFSSLSSPLWAARRPPLPLPRGLAGRPGPSPASPQHLGAAGATPRGPGAWPRPR